MLHPPQEIRQAAHDLGFEPTTLEAHGYDAIETRGARSYEQSVATGQFTFRSRGDAVRLHDVVTFQWESVDLRDAGAVTGGGLEVLVLDEDGRIVTDYMFPTRAPGRQQRRRGGVRRQERLQLHLRHGHVERGRERRDRGREPQLLWAAEFLAPTGTDRHSMTPPNSEPFSCAQQSRG
ncbi:MULTISPECIES: hypothetical protein [Streptosporangium]|uniref:SnoaL-like domain-containing protein n=1 Tax=Streptosporangium brasiliense TaxID=47480 RepID=A0ABT9RHW4_9ACTN|nr:hypothetical protein [Streptosporangium brasiliense]MDP9868876.1 hypothetical protein [Streptosporangium brasiliense]